MNTQEAVVDIGSQVGSEAAEHISHRAEDYCECERQRIELASEARIRALHFEGERLSKYERQLEERLRAAAPTRDGRSRRRKALFHWATGIMLAIAAFFFSLLAFAPYRLGWTGDLYCLGIALVTPFAVEEFLDAWRSERLFKAMVTVVFLAALAGGGLLAAIRGDLLSQEVQQNTAPVAIDGDTSSSTPPQTFFYDSTQGSLRILMLLLAVAIDLGAGVAVHRALILSAASCEDCDKLREELTEARERLAEIIYEITTLTNAPAIFVAQFWRDFYRAMLTQTARNAATKLLGLSLCLLLFGAGRAGAQRRLNLVVAVDLSASVAARGPDQQTQFDKDIKGVGRLLALVPAGSKVTVIGIIENSFAQPDVLLSAEISNDQGYFGERLAAARQQIVHAWQIRSVKLRPTARSTDIFGALVVAGEMLRDSPSLQRKLLVIYSDMRQDTRQVNFNRSASPNIDATLTTVNRGHLFADLRGVNVFVLGADASGRDIAQWDSLKQFWVAYFAKAGATLSGYSVLCGAPKLDP
jgi:hypothetical protein